MKGEELFVHNLDLIFTFCGGLMGALVFGYIAQRWRISPIVGYLLAGIMVGPFTPGYTANSNIAGQFAEIGVILLMFGIGLRFHLSELMAVWRVAVPGALIQSTMSTLALAALLRTLGWTWTAGIILGMAISVASTVVMALVLGEKNDLHSPTGYIAIGWTVVEDIITVAMLLILPIAFVDSGDEKSMAAALGLAGLKIVGLTITVIGLGLWVIPRTFEMIAKTKARELFTLAVLVMSVGIAVGSVLLFGVSLALGAFLAGLAVGRTEFAARAAGDAMPMRDAFAVLFFVSVGMAFNPNTLLESPIPILMVLFVVVMIKPLAAAFTVCLLGRPRETAIRVGASFSQVGEFSFILGAEAYRLGLIDVVGLNAMVAASIISIAMNPTVYRWARGLSIRVQEKKTRVRLPQPLDEDRCIDRNRYIMLGFGPVGRIVYKLLTARGGDVSIIDLNFETVREIIEKGGKAVHGDALQPGTLEAAGIAEAGTLILSAKMDCTPEIVKLARQYCSRIRIVARCEQLSDVDALKAAGADLVVAGEAEIGVSMLEVLTADAEYVDLGATIEEREAARIWLYSEGFKSTRMIRAKK